MFTCFVFEMVNKNPKTESAFRFKLYVHIICCCGLREKNNLVGINKKALDGQGFKMAG